MKLHASLVVCTAVAGVLLPAGLLSAQQVITGPAAFADWSQQKPGTLRKITAADLPAPFKTESVDNGPTVISRPKDAWPIAPPGFKVELYAGGDAATPMQRADDVRKIYGPTSGTFVMPRIIHTAPNGDLFVSDSQAGSIFVLRGVTAEGKAQTVSQFASGLDHPFGIAFYPAGSDPKWIYVGTATQIVRFAYKPGDLKAESNTPQVIIPDIPGYAQLRGGGHWTRDVIFTADDKHMLISVGSGSNIDDPDTHPREFHRADVLEYTPEGKFVEVYASGIRNCVGEAINPVTKQLWCSTNERDQLGSNLPPDYVTHIEEGGFYGWPWYYIGDHKDPRLPLPCANGSGPNPQLTAPLSALDAASCKRIDIGSKVLTPDVLVQPHMASLGMTFYPGHSANFPAEYEGDGFAAEHGSWNRARRGGYEVIMFPMKDGKALGEYEDFLTGFVTADGQVWGRPVGVTVGHDGALYVTDDGSRSIWRVVYTGK
ncbi:MAG TPA: PQQ-dependent sugar dehydrogenase [Nevskiaceae bacterium]|nr:PQQ-dependent sugar dehydrogenase [Nevskiaceae bacterium]